MARIFKVLFVVFAILGTGVFGVAVWAMHEMRAYDALPPAQRAEMDRKAEVHAEIERREQLKGTDCEKLDALSCYELRRQRKNLEAAARAWQDSELKDAYDDAGVR